MPQLDLSHLKLLSRHLRTLQSLLAQHVPKAQVWAYGSRVIGGGHEGSDLDLVLRHPDDPSIAVEGSCALEEALQNSHLPMLVEVHQWSTFPASFHRNIEAQYVVVWDGSHAADEA